MPAYRAVQVQEDRERGMVSDTGGSANRDLVYRLLLISNCGGLEMAKGTEENLRRAGMNVTCCSFIFCVPCTGSFKCREIGGRVPRLRTVEETQANPSGRSEEGMLAHLYLWPVYRAIQILRRLRSTPNVLVFKHSPRIVDSLIYHASSLYPLHQYKRNSDRQDFARVARYLSPTTIFSPLILSARISRRPRTHTHASHAQARAGASSPVHSLLRTPSRSHAAPNHACVISISRSVVYYTATLDTCSSVNEHKGARA